MSLMPSVPAAPGRRGPSDEELCQRMEGEWMDAGDDDEGWTDAPPPPTRAAAPPAHQRANASTEAEEPGDDWLDDSGLLEADEYDADAGLDADMDGGGDDDSGDGKVAGTGLATSALGGFRPARELHQDPPQGGIGAAAPAVRLLTFGFRYGRPPATARVFDVRRLPNPSKHSRTHMTGLDARLQSELSRSPDFQQACSDICAGIEALALGASDAAAMDEQETTEAVAAAAVAAVAVAAGGGQGQPVVVAIGCEHGRHRSVATAESVARELSRRGVAVTAVEHRDLHRSKDGGGKGGGGGGKGGRQRARDQKMQSRGDAYDEY